MVLGEDGALAGLKPGGLLVDQTYCLFLRYTTLLAVEELILRYLGGGRLVLDNARAIVHLSIREGMRTALIANQ